MNNFDKILDDLQINKDNWLLTKFGDIAIQQKENVDRENTNLTKYVKGEHMGSEDLHLCNWGELTDEYLGPAFIRKFEKGDILYGSRRTYLRKVVIAPFSGITSNTTFVIKSSEDNIDKRLLPFIMMSESFTENSIINSKGSVNPYINWKDISKYEFLLPPKEDQAKLAELLWAMDEVIQKQNALLDKLRIKLYSQVKELFEDYENKTQIKHFVLNSKPKKANIGSNPYIEIGDVNTSNKTIKFKKKESVKGAISVNKGSILVSKVRPNRGAITLLEKDHVVSSAFSVLIPEEKLILTEYLFHCLAWNNHFSNLMLRLATGTTYPTISNDNILNYKIPFLELDKQEIYSDKLNNIYKATINAELVIKSSKTIQKSLINQIF